MLLVPKPEPITGAAALPAAPPPSLTTEDAACPYTPAPQDSANNALGATSRGISEDVMEIGREKRLRRPKRARCASPEDDVPSEALRKKSKDPKPEKRGTQLPGDSAKKGKASKSPAKAVKSQGPQSGSSDAVVVGNRSPVLKAIVRVLKAAGKGAWLKLGAIAKKLEKQKFPFKSTLNTPKHHVLNAVNRHLKNGITDPKTGTVAFLLLVRADTKLAEPEVSLVADAGCMRCGGTGDENLLLLCDYCARGWHLFCLQGKHRRKRVPSGLWKCPSCCGNDPPPPPPLPFPPSSANATTTSAPTRKASAAARATKAGPSEAARRGLVATAAAAAAAEAPNKPSEGTRRRELRQQHGSEAAVDTAAGRIGSSVQNEAAAAGTRLVAAGLTARRSREGDRGPQSPQQQQGAGTSKDPSTPKANKRWRAWDPAMDKKSSPTLKKRSPINNTPTPTQAPSPSRVSLGGPFDSRREHPEGASSRGDLQEQQREHGRLLRRPLTAAESFGLPVSIAKSCGTPALPLEARNMPEQTPQGRITISQPQQQQQQPQGQQLQLQNKRRRQGTAMDVLRAQGLRPAIYAKWSELLDFDGCLELLRDEGALPSGVPGLVEERMWRLTSDPDAPDAVAAGG